MVIGWTAAGADNPVTGCLEAAVQRIGPSPRGNPCSAGYRAVARPWDACGATAPL